MTTVARYRRRAATRAVWPPVVGTLLLLVVVSYLGGAGVSQPQDAPRPAAAQSVPDVTIAKRATEGRSPTTPDVTTYTAGAPQMYFQLDVTNSGPGTATGLTVSDALPDGFTPNLATGSGWNCTINGQDVACTRPSLAVTMSTITIQAAVDSALVGQQTNTATVTTDQDPTPKSGSVTLGPNPQSDMDIYKVHDSTPVAGGQLTYDFTVTNLGPSDTPSFTVTDSLDPNLTYDPPATGISCPPNGQDLTCNGGALEAGRTASFSITVDVDPAYPTGTPLLNTGTVSSPIPDPVPGNNSYEDSTDVEASADLSITKTHTGPAVAGTQTSYTIGVHNAGPSTDQPAGDIRVTDHLPTGLTYVPGASGGTDWSCTETSGTVRCQYSQDLGPVADTPDLTLTVALDASLRGPVTNTARVSAGVPDPDLDNNVAGAPITVTGESDLAITKSHTGDFVAGTQQRFDFTVVNQGPSSDTPSFTVTDTLHPHLSFVAAEGDASCTAAGQEVTCTGGLLRPSGTATFTMTVAIAADAPPGDIANTATVEPPPGTSDPDLSNNTTPADVVTITAEADLRLTKSHTGAVAPGGEVEFRIDVTNDGPSTVPSFEVTDSLDARLSYVSSSGDATCTPSGQDLTCTGSALAAGQTARISIVVRAVDGLADGTMIGNTAQVASPPEVPDPDPATDSDTTVVEVANQADLSIVKTGAGAFVAGEPARYEITVTNHGPTDVSDGEVRVVDELPDGVSYLSAEGDGWSCVSAGQTVTCRLAGLFEDGQSSAVTLHVQLAATVQGAITNQATVDSPVPDPDPDNSTAHHTVQVDSPAGPEADLESVLHHQPRQYYAGDPVVFTYTVINHGPSAGEDVLVTHRLPAGAYFPGGTTTAAGGGAAARELVPAAYTSGSSDIGHLTAGSAPLRPLAATAAPKWPLSCTRDGSQRLECRADTLPVGTYQVRMEARIDGGFTGSITSELDVTAATADPDPDNNRSTDVVPDVLLVAGGSLPGTGFRATVLVAAAGGVLMGIGLLLACFAAPRRARTVAAGAVACPRCG